jgi:hypothetical protein
MLWAETFTPASAREVLSWIPVVGYRVLWRFARTLLPLLAVLAVIAYVFLGPIVMGFEYVGPWSWYVVVAAAGLVLTAPIVLLVMAWFLLLPFTGGVGGRVNETIGAIIGDAWVLTHSPTRFSRMRRRFAGGYADVRGGSPARPSSAWPRNSGRRCCSGQA